MAIASVCSLTQSRARGYAVLPPERCAEADIMLVEADDPNACEQWVSSPACRNGRPALMITRDLALAGQQPYALSRANFATRLLRSLDQIAIREFKFVPELIIGETHAAADLGLSSPGMSVRSGSSPGVLVVDDSIVVRTQMRTLLGLYGLHPDLATTAEQGLTLTSTKRYEIVFLDVVLPGIDGYAACRQMKSIGHNAPPVVLLTSRDSPFDKIRGVMAGCSRYLTKPIGAAALCKVLQEFLPEHAIAAADMN
jgi:twitching motility two-component system response regulator PilG